MATIQAIRHRITPFWLLGFLFLLLALTGLLNWSAATHRVDRLLHDKWVRSSQRPAPTDIVIAAIDSDSLQQLGRWPWSRELQSHLFRQLSRHGVKAVVVDVLYTEAGSSVEQDRDLAMAMSSAPVVILPVLTEGRVGPGAAEKLPLPVLTREVSDLGHIFLPIDDDGIVRRVHLKSGFNSPHWPTLALAAFSSIEPDNAAIVALPGKRLPRTGFSHRWEQDYEVLIPFYGPSGTFAKVSATRIISGQAEAAQLRNKIVFVGLTATGLVDVVPTPVSALDQPVPGVEIHANIYAALRDGSLVTRVDNRLNLLVSLVLLPMMLLVYSRAPPQWGLLCAALGALLPIALSLVLYRYARWWYAPLASSVPILVSYLVWSWHRLDFLNRFLVRENHMFEPHQTPVDSHSNDLLADFFICASVHLPIIGWRFSARGEQFQGGRPISKGGQITADNWTRHKNVFAKRFPTPGRLEIQLAIADTELGQQFTAFIDTLDRVRSRTRPSRFSGSIERLQSNAMTLSDNMAWLRSFRVFTETILAGSPAGFIVWNAAGEMVRSNHLLFEFLPSLNRRCQLADFMRTLGHDPINSTDQGHLQALLLGGESWQLTHVANEAEYIIDFNTVGDNLAERLVCASVIDVSEIRSAERARAEIVDYLSHDLRSPLISALYLLESDESEPARSDKQNKPVNKHLLENTTRIEENIRRSLKMMDDLLHVARADSLSPGAFAELLFNAVVDNALGQLLPQARSREIRLSFDSSDDDFWMDGDAALLERAVVNIIGNAIKYSATGDTVSVRLERQQNSVVLQVTDQGVGIDPDMMGQLFTRFKRDARIADKFAGIGLGLALVSRVVRQHSGEVIAQSPGKGTRIVMTLPLKVVED